MLNENEGRYDRFTVYASMRAMIVKRRVRATGRSNVHQLQVYRSESLVWLTMTTMSTAGPKMVQWESEQRRSTEDRPASRGSITP